MFEFYTNNTFEGQNSFSWISIIQLSIQMFTLGVAFIALYTARKSLNTANENLNGASRTQSVQAHMNLITLQSEVSKNIVKRLIATRRLSEFKEGDDMNLLIFEQNEAFIEYFSSVDKLASIINTPYFPRQFPNNKGEINTEKWKTEYYNIFDDARTYANDYNSDDLVKSQMIQNIIALLDIWDKENSNHLTENPPNATITNSLPNT